MLANEEKALNRQCDKEISNVQFRLETNLKTKKLEIKQIAESAIKVSSIGRRFLFYPIYLTEYLLYYYNRK